ncbi:putative oxidase assembly protein [Tieghemostelium lacteum]|uniref:Putative oxidase assembly protein n=1 Tax=Tieghemostelium lacteum TaxID=361077 RepID=A0A151ZCA5_TIELA|nr:putative oxidase assembly protein [Tieghemostelium lacteum]|eukprot:KYQ91583.1 putative oxidase assembly protein [Tieghemostelium lacteum]
MIQNNRYLLRNTFKLLKSNSLNVNNGFRGSLKYMSLNNVNSDISNKNTLKSIFSSNQIFNSQSNLMNGTIRFYTTQPSQNNTVGESNKEVLTDHQQQLLDQVFSVTPEQVEKVNPIVQFFTENNDKVIQHLDHFHHSVGAPWWVIISGIAVSLRLLTLPFTIKSQKVGAIMQDVKEEVEKHAYLNDGTNEGRMKIMSMQHEIMQSKGISPLTMFKYTFIQLPFLIYPFYIIRTLSDNTTLLKNADFLWIHDLSGTGYVLPVVSSIVQYLSIRVTMTESTPLVMKAIMHGLCVLPLIFTIHFSHALNLYWVTNSLIFLATNYLFRKNNIRKIFGIPPMKDGLPKETPIQYAPNPFASNANNNANEQLTKQIIEKNKLIEKKRQEIQNLRKR